MLTSPINERQLPTGDRGAVVGKLPGRQELAHIMF